MQLPLTFVNLGPGAFMAAVFVDSFLSDCFGRMNAVKYNYKLYAFYIAPWLWRTAGDLSKHQKFWRNESREGLNNERHGRAAFN